MERLQSLSAADALAEGVMQGDDTAATADAATRLYRGVWERLHGAGSWQVDPWVWVICFGVECAG